MDVFSKNMKVSSLLEANYYLMMVLARVGIEGSCGEKTVAEACEQAGLDPDTIIMLCKVYSVPDYKPSVDDLRRSHISDVLRYLHQSHDYYLNTAMKEIADSIEKLIEPCRESSKKVVWEFFSGYQVELKKHFEFEEGEVIPYVQNLILGRSMPDFNIDRFEETHSNIEDKLSDLKNLVMKSLPHECDDLLRIRLLQFILALEQDLTSHTYVEDNVLVPMVRLLENPHKYHSMVRIEEEEEAQHSTELSDREKEILVSVAQGLINKEIAEKHHISVNTVITHRKNITRKTGIKTVPGLTVYAILNNLIDINTFE